MGQKTKPTKSLERNGELLSMCLPAIIKIFIFSYLPMVGIIIAFKNYMPRQGIFGSAWVGLKNFEFFFRSNTAWRVLRNTVAMNMVGLVLSTVVHVAVALLLYEVIRRSVLKTYQTVMFIPYFFSWVLVGLMMTVFFSPTNGMLTKAAAILGNPNVNFYATPGYWLAILPVISVWKGLGFGSLVYYSALMGIDREIFEAAEIDGANKWQRTWAISIPYIMPMITVMTILSLGNIIRADFGLFYFVPQRQSQLFPVTDVIDTFVFRALAENGDFGMSSAVGLFQSVVGFLMVIAANMIAKSADEDYSLF